MEIESDSSEKIHLKVDTPTVLGRGAGIDAEERTVSRRHISLELHSNGHESDRDSNPRVSFEVLGKNTVWVRRGENGEIRVYGKGEKGELGRGDAFSVCGRKLIWFGLKREVEGRVEDEGFGDVSDLEIEDFDVDVSGIDPVKEFGFIVAGHEFDSYSKRMIHDAKKWNWCLEEPKNGSDGDEAEEQRSRGRRRKRKKGKGKWDNRVENDDDDWEGESDEDKELISQTKNVPRPIYSTRSKNRRKSIESVSNGNGKSEARESSTPSDEEMGDEDNETLGGFIVNSDEVIENVGDVDEEDEEEEFEDDEEADLE